MAPIAPGWDRRGRQGESKVPDVEAGKPIWAITACAKCSGSGTCPSCKGRRRSLLVLPCSTCGGRGYCRLCRGTGEAFEVEAARPADVERVPDDGPFRRFSRARRRARRESKL